MSALTALSPLDGRYQAKTAQLAPAFSELALIKYRLHIEVEWLIALAEEPLIAQLPPLSTEDRSFLRQIVAQFDETAGEKVKTIERKTNHDVKSVEYFLKEAISERLPAIYLEFVHFACTSEDINNLAHALMLKHGVKDIWLKQAHSVIEAINGLASKYQAVPMLARTHGQPASPTTVGKEMAVFSHRLQRQYRQIEKQDYLGKINGAVGNFNAHSIAYPELNWPQFAQNFVESTLGLSYNPLTTQIESHDYMAELFHALARFNSIIIDFNRDVWLYISKGYFKERVAEGEVGSSTMPHKVNPIDFENSEGNMGLSNALLNFMAGKLAISRWQRDLTDSTTLRNMGTAVGYSYLALKSTARGIAKLSVDEALLAADLAQSWEVLGEAVQTVMRKAGLENPYEQLKAITRGKGITQEALTAFIEGLPLAQDDKARLLALTPDSYVGLAEDLVEIATKNA